jgi:hypothetical protein
MLGVPRQPSLVASFTHNTHDAIITGAFTQLSRARPCSTISRRAHTGSSRRSAAQQTAGVGCKITGPAPPLAFASTAPQPTLIQEAQPPSALLGTRLLAAVRPLPNGGAADAVLSAAAIPAALVRRRRTAAGRRRLLAQAAAVRPRPVHAAGGRAKGHTPQGFGRLLADPRRHHRPGAVRATAGQGRASGAGDAPPALLLDVPGLQVHHRVRLARAVGGTFDGRVQVAHRQRQHYSAGSSYAGNQHSRRRRWRRRLRRAGPAAAEAGASDAVADTAAVSRDNLR